MTENNRHTIRFRAVRNHPVWWECTCGRGGYSVRTAESHAFVAGGRIETAGAPR